MMFLDQADYMESSSWPDNIKVFTISRVNLFNKRYWSENGLYRSGRIDEKAFDNWTRNRLDVVRTAGRP